MNSDEELCLSFYLESLFSWLGDHLAVLSSLHWHEVVWGPLAEQLWNEFAEAGTIGSEGWNMES